MHRCFRLDTPHLVQKLSPYQCYAEPLVGCGRESPPYLNDSQYPSQGKAADPPLRTRATHAC